MVSRIEATTAVSSTRRSVQFKVRPIGQAFATESDTKPNFHIFSVSWDLADKLSRPILAAATSTLHSTNDEQKKRTRTFHGPLCPRSPPLLDNPTPETTSYPHGYQSPPPTSEKKRRTPVEVNEMVVLNGVGTVRTVITTTAEAGTRDRAISLHLHHSSQTE